MINLQPIQDFHVLISEKSDGSFSSQKEVKSWLEAQQVEPPICYFHHQHQAHRFLHLEKSSLPVKPIWADSVITNQNICPAMMVADCFPVLIVDQNNQTFALVHAGWKPLLQNIIELTIQDMRLRLSTKPTQLLAWIGPGIRPCCYRFPKKPVQADLPDWQAHVSQTKGSRWQIDLPGFIKQNLKQLGLPSRQILDSSQCTGCNESLFSHHLAQTEQIEPGRLAAAVYRQKTG